jgi:hypothetical protein
MNSELRKTRRLLGGSPCNDIRVDQQKNNRPILSLGWPKPIQALRTPHGKIYIFRNQSPGREYFVTKKNVLTNCSVTGFVLSIFIYPVT